MVILHYAPFDAHVHFRRAHLLKAVAPYTARQCWGAVVMPNTAPHILTPEDARRYKIDVAASLGERFFPVMTGYLTPQTTPEDVECGFKGRVWYAMKAYPPGATTHSAEGVAGRALLHHPALPVMQELGMPLLLHGEVNFDGVEVDPYDREAVFIDEVLGELLTRYPRLKISLEHITTEYAATFIQKHGSDRLVCTITAHHLLLDRRDFFRGGPNPHLHCWPVLKRSGDREALRALVARNTSFVIAGSDSAPHPTTSKERACGCAGGVFTAHALVPLYTQILEEIGALDALENFLCLNGPRFFSISPKRAHMVLRQSPWTMNTCIPVGDGSVVRPFGYHENPEERFQFSWRISEFV